MPPHVSRAAESAAAQSVPQLPLSAHDDWRVGTAALDALLRLRRRSRASRTRRSAAAEAEGKAEAEEAAEAAALAATRRAAASDDWYVRALRTARRSGARAHRAGMRRGELPIAGRHGVALAAKRRSAAPRAAPLSAQSI